MIPAPPAPPVEDPIETARTEPASVGQASLWFLRQVMPYKSPYNTAIRFRLLGELDADAIIEAIHEIARRHESCRTTFGTVDGTVVQIIHPEMPADVALVDLGGAGDPEAEAQRLERAVASEPFDLDRGPLVRVRLVRIGPRHHSLVVVLDHIVADGMSLGVIWRELEALYPALSAGAPSPLPPPRKQYVECVEAQNRWLATPAFARQLEHWAHHLAGAAPCDLPTDKPRPPIKSYRGNMIHTRIPRALVERIQALGAAEDISVFTVLLAALEVLLARYSAQSDISVLVPVACRNRFAAEEVIGYFANVLVLRNQVPDELPFRELLKQVRSEVMTGLLRQDVPFERVIERINPERSLSHDPLASVGLSFLPARGSKLQLPGVEATYREISNGGSKFDLHFFAAEVEGELSLTTEYNSDIYDQATIERLVEHYLVVLDEAVAQPSATVAELPCITEAERQRILLDFNTTAADYRRAAIPDLVHASAARTPDALAASFDGTPLSYAQLERRGNQVARCLRARGVSPGDLVGIAVERSLDMLVGLLGILKAGAAYVPLDPAYPRDRLALMADDSGLRVLVTQQHLTDLVPSQAVLRLDADAPEIDAASDEPLGLGLDPESLAYVIYTSGSTGRPKGVQISHRAVANFLASMALQPGITSKDRLLAVTSLSFDIAGLELWLPLCVGAHVEIASRDTATSGAALRTRLEQGAVTVIQATPSTFRLLIEAGWTRSPSLKVLVGGEAVPRELAAQLVERAGSVWNMYGPTETTIWSCIHPLRRNEPVLIGRPIANTQVYVLDRHLRPVPPRVTGEVYIGGDGVARGYLARPELTAERFIQNPFAPGRIYRTGDLGRLQPDGALEYLGRNDFQVKLRGYRIELGEIETHLASHPAVREAVVAAFEEAPGDQRLVAYFTARAEPPPLDELRAHLRARLPEYMVPARLILLDKLPLTANNKVDRKALPRPDKQAALPGAVVDGDDAPREAVEFKLRAIWEDVLGLRGIGVRDRFFDLGGHSLLALKLFERIGAAFSVQLPLAALFEAPTIEKLAELLRRKGWEPSWSTLVPIRTTGARPPFFCVHAAGGNVLNYRLLSQYVGEDQPFYGLQARGLGGTEPPHTTVAEMARDYIIEIRSVQPRGPYLLGGGSSGGTVAYEMAQQLHASGDDVALLVLIDTLNFGPPSERVLHSRAASPLHHRAMRLDLHWGELLLRPIRSGADYLAGRLRARMEGVANPIQKTMKEAPSLLRKVFAANVRAIGEYVPRRYPGAAVMLLASDIPDRTSFDTRLSWADLVEGGLTVRFIPGDHDNMLDEPRVRGVAEILRQCLDQALARPQLPSETSGVMSGAARTA